jgi:hypothetical protein
VKGQSDWYDDIAKRIGEIKSTLNEKDYKKYKLDLFLCVAQRVAEFSTVCTECHTFQQDITSLNRDMSNLVQIGDKEGRKAYFKSLNKVIGHLQRQHKLVTEGYYMGLGMALGSGLGVAIGAAMDNVGTGIPIGVGCGIAIGAFLDAKAKKEGRILCPRESVRFSKAALVLLVVVGLLALGGILAFVLFNRSA